jgi:hypothetical protein
LLRLLLRLLLLRLGLLLLLLGTLLLLQHRHGCLKLCRGELRLAIRWPS